MLRLILILGFTLGIYWIGLSGHFTPLLLTLGGGSIIFVLILCLRMDLLDEETAPYLIIPKALSYYAWLGREIIKANTRVAKLVLKPDMEVEPTLTKVAMEQDSDLGRSIFANSITLTPGTISIEMESDRILVHALCADMAEPENFTDMALRSAWAAGEVSLTEDESSHG